METSQFIENLAYDFLIVYSGLRFRKFFGKISFYAKKVLSAYREWLLKSKI